MRSKKPSAMPQQIHVEISLHKACVKAGAYAITFGISQRVPLIKPLLAKSMLSNLVRDNPNNIQKNLIREIYQHHDLKATNWEIAAIQAVAKASSQKAIATIALEQKLKSMLGETLTKIILKYSPLSQWLPEIVDALSQTWAAGRYADSVGRVRKMGEDWLPAPLAKQLKLPNSKLMQWTEEAFELALPVFQTLKNLKKSKRD
jgi:hypothetical protein